MTKAPRSEIVAGVTITSRHGIEREMIRMRRSVESLPEQLRVRVVGYFCDSKAGHHYGVEVREPEAAKALAPLLVPLRFSYLSITCRGEPVLEMTAG